MVSPICPCTWFMVKAGDSAGTAKYEDLLFPRSGLEYCGNKWWKPHPVAYKSKTALDTSLQASLANTLNTQATSVLSGVCWPQAQGSCCPFLALPWAAARVILGLCSCRPSSAGGFLGTAYCFLYLLWSWELFQSLREIWGLGHVRNVLLLIPIITRTTFDV